MGCAHPAPTRIGEISNFADGVYISVRSRRARGKLIGGDAHSVSAVLLTELERQSTATGLQWRRRSPDAPGLYWLKRDDAEPTIVSAWACGGDRPDTVAWLGSPCDQEIKDIRNALWCGPLTPPT